MMIITDIAVTTKTVDSIVIVSIVISNPTGSVIRDNGPIGTTCANSANIFVNTGVHSETTGYAITSIAGIAVDTFTSAGDASGVHEIASTAPEWYRRYVSLQGQQKRCPAGDPASPSR